MSFQPNPVRPNKDPAVKPGPECEVNGMDDENDVPEDEDEMVMRAVDEADRQEGLAGDCADQDEVEEPPPAPPMDASGEAVRTRTLRRPGQPTQKQIRDHKQASHLPYRSWCKFCVEGKGLHDHHRSGREEDKFDKQVPCISMDYCFMGDGETEAKENPILTTYDNNTGSLHTYVVKKKGVVMWLPKAIGSDLEHMGYKGCRVSVKSDQENSVMAVKRSVAEWRSAPTSMIEAPVRESKCNGKMERAVQNFQGQLRTLKLSLEDSIGAKIDVRSRIFGWLCTWACTSLNRYHVGVDGLTAFARVTGTQCSRPIAEFGEQVLWKRSVKRYPNKADTL